MKILHYFLGFPPYRTGGMTKFVFDLMTSQKEEGNEVYALYPGKMNFILNRDRTEIIKKKSVNNIISFEIVNPLPVSLDEGIKDFNAFTKRCDNEVYKEFLNEIKPSAIHIHTLMGLHKEFIEVANELKIKTVFTTHDYFGICPKVTLYKYGEVCDNDSNCRDCIGCCHSALSINKIKLMQSHLYKKLKNSFIIKIIRKKHRQNFFEESKPRLEEKQEKIDTMCIEYQNLRKYYVNMLENIDIIHFNSNLTKKIYLRYIKPKNYKVISITHKNIKDNRNNPHIKSDKIRFTFLASTKPYKGFYLLKEVLDELHGKTKYDFELNVYSYVNEKDRSEYMNVYENGFKQSELPEIFSKTDLLVAPSIWYETFGFTVLEALSYGVPVLVSNHVGAVDIVEKSGNIFKSKNKEDLKNYINKLDKDHLLELNKNVKLIDLIIWDKFYNECIEMYKEGA